MDINALFPSNYLKASDLQGQPRKVVIESIAPEEIAQGEVKPVVRLRGVTVLDTIDLTTASNRTATLTIDVPGGGS